jgi:transcriptional antiterminator RfaH
VPYWAVAQTESRREHVARMFLMREQFETYMPRIKRQGRMEPLFPAYIFIRVVDVWYRARWTIGVTRIIMDGERPARLADEIVNSIRGREIDGVIVLPRAPHFRSGQQVRIRKGAFEGLVGIYDGMAGVDRERVLLNLLGRKVPVVLPARDVIAMEK